MSAKRSPVAYLYSGTLTRLCSNVERCKCRTAMVHSLVHAYNLFEYMKLLEPSRATESELRLFHSQEYVDFCLKKLNGDDYTQSEAAEFGIDCDCPPSPSIPEYVRYVGGAGVSCARALNAGLCRVAINWAGGWHHAKEGSAAGFCYVNDCALAILTLREKFRTVMYVDIDAHHGDGVQQAFYATKRVPCLSFHQYESGFYPGTGSSEECGIGPGYGYNINFPVKPGLSDGQFLPIFERLLAQCDRTWQPDAIVLQCGCDSLSGDALANLDLSTDAFVHVATRLAGLDLPMVVLGGGGYHAANAARCWVRVTHALIKATSPNPDAVPDLCEDIPENDYFEQYGSDFTLQLDASKRVNRNCAADLEILCADFEEMLQDLVE